MRYALSLVHLHDNLLTQYYLSILISQTGLQTPYYETSIAGEEEHEVSPEEGETHAGNATEEEIPEHEETRRGLSSTGESNSDLTPDVPHHGELTYSLYASTLSPLAEQSVLIAALIMIFVYVCILLEPIHRTLIALFGSFIALFFLFLMHGGHTESISTIMLHMEWSTLGLVSDLVHRWYMLCTIPSTLI